VLLNLSITLITIKKKEKIQKKSIFLVCDQNYILNNFNYFLYKNIIVC